MRQSFPLDEDMLLLILKTYKGIDKSIYSLCLSNAMEMVEPQHKLLFGKGKAEKYKPPSVRNHTEVLPSRMGLG